MFYINSLISEIGVKNFGNDIEVGPLVVFPARQGGKLSKLILKFNFLLISRALARFDAEMFQRRVNCYIVSKTFQGSYIIAFYP